MSTAVASSLDPLGGMCVVFRFDRGSALLVRWEPDRAWVTVVNRIRSRNAGVHVVERPGSGGPDGPDA